MFGQDIIKPTNIPGVDTRIRFDPVQIMLPRTGQRRVEFVTKGVRQLSDGTYVGEAPDADVPPWVRREIASGPNDADVNLAVATQTVTVTDPVTKQSVTISVAGLGEAIAAFGAKWFAEDEAARQAGAGGQPA